MSKQIMNKKRSGRDRREHAGSGTRVIKGIRQKAAILSTTGIMQAMKEMFRDVIQTAMEVELDEELGRETL